MSTTLGYVLSLGITSLLIGGLLIAGGTFVEDQRERAARSELEVIGQQLAADAGSADRLAATTSAGSGGVEIERGFPERVTGSAYSVEVERLGDRDVYELTLSMEDPEVAVTVRSYSGTPLYGMAGLRGGELAVQSNGALTPKLFLTAPDEDPVFVERDGLVALEAEGPLATDPGTGQESDHYWTTYTADAASGDTAIYALPNVSSGDGTTGHTGDTLPGAASGPRLDYPVRFETTGTYCVWVRMQAPGTDSGNSDSVHVGLDGTLVTTGADGLSEGAPSGTGNWDWVHGLASDGTTDDYVTLNVGSPGEHTLNLWMREDGTRVDKIVLKHDCATDGSDDPSGTGPDAM